MTKLTEFLRRAKERAEGVRVACASQCDTAGQCVFTSTRCNTNERVFLAMLEDAFGELRKAEKALDETVGVIEHDSKYAAYLRLKQIDFRGLAAIEENFRNGKYGTAR